MEVFFESGAVILLALPFAIDIVRRLWKKTGLVPAFTGAPCALAFFLGAIFRSLEYEGDLLIVSYIFGTVFALWSFVIGEETAKKN